MANEEKKRNRKGRKLNKKKADALRKMHEAEGCSESRESSPGIPALGAQCCTNTELDDSNFGRSRFVWETFASLAPFVKISVTKDDDSVERKLRIASKNETNEETAGILAEWVQGAAVILSHSAALLKNYLPDLAIIDTVKCSGKKLEVTVSAETRFSIWEDTDLWIFPASPSPSSSPYSNQPNTSTANERSPENLVKQSRELSQQELFQLIHSWKYLGGRFQRMRRKFGDKWKNVYLTELQMAPVDEKKTALLEFVKKDTVLRLSNDIDEFGEIFVEVCRNNTSKSEESIIFAITGFARSDVNMPLSKETTYYLNVDDGDDDEWGSQTSEVDILTGYPLLPNLDEFCEKLGELKVLDVCIKTWFAVPHNVAFIRLVVTSKKRKMHHFKKLHGAHVIIQNSIDEKEMVLAVVSRVMNNEMILTLKAIPRNGISYCFEKEDTLTIQIDHAYDQRLQQLNGYSGKMEKIRRQLFSHDSDLRFLRDWRVKGETKKRTYASFTYKNKAMASIPFNTKVLLSKCWEVEGQLERKAEFVFAVRVENEKTNFPSANVITFEIKFTRNLIKNAPDFELTNAFYYIDFDTSYLVRNDSYYTLLDARCATAAPRETITRSCPISDQLKFSIIQFTPWKPTRSEGSQSQASGTGIRSQTSCSERTNRKEDQNHQVTLPLVPELLPPENPNSSKLLKKIDPKRHHKRGFVFILELPSYASEKPLVVIRYGFNVAGDKIKATPLNIGKRLVFTEGMGHDDIKIGGDVYDTMGENVTVLIDQDVSDLPFLHKWSTNTPLLSYEEM